MCLGTIDAGHARFQTLGDNTGGSLGKIKIVDYACGLVVTIVGLGLYSYYVRELSASLLLFSAVFFAMGLFVLIVVPASQGNRAGKQDYRSHIGTSPH